MKNIINNKQNQKGIDYTKDNIYDAISRPDLKPKEAMMSCECRHDGSTWSSVFCEECGKNNCENCIRQHPSPDEKYELFKKATEPLIKFMNDEVTMFDPHSIIIVTPTTANLLSGEIGLTTKEFLKD